MQIQFTRRLRSVVAVSALSATCFVSPCFAVAQETGSDKVIEEVAEEEDVEEKDPFAVPEDASPEELLKFMDSVIRTPPPKDTSRADLAKKVFPAIIAAADKIITQEDASEFHVDAIQRKLNAYGILARYDRSVTEAADAFIQECASDTRDEVAMVGLSSLLSKKAATITKDTEEAAADVASEALKLVERFGATAQTTGLGSSIASNLNRRGHSEISKDLYIKIAECAEQSDDEDIVASAKRMRGAVRRMDLLGSSMEVFGTTADGEEFDLADYKGKVVLVDFWASWCGPCIGELPNMKRNLQTYGERGFEIVGINMDSTIDRFEKCIDEKEITWTNIVSWKEGENGWQAPMATHYGISGIPTAILIDPEGKVVSLNARGKSLDESLAELLGPPKTPETEEATVADADADVAADGDDK